MFISFLYHLKTGKQPFHKPATATYGHTPPPQTLNGPFIYKTKLSTNKKYLGFPFKALLSGRDTKRTGKGSIFL